MKAATENKDHGLIDNWLRHIKDVWSLHSSELNSLQNESDRYTRLCELNVIEQVFNVCEISIVLNSWKNGQELSVHGWIYDIADGILKDLDITVTNEDEAREVRGKK